MDEIIKKSQVLRGELEKLPLFQEYKRVKNIYENNEEIKELKTLIVRAKNENRLDEHEALLEKLHNHPLYINYMELDNEVKSYLKEISDYLNK